MRITTPFQGSLFANDFLCESIIESPDWQALDDSALDSFKASVREGFDRFPTMQTPNESQTATRPSTSEGRPPPRSCVRPCWN